MSTIQVQDLLAKEHVNGHTSAFGASEPPRKRPRVNQACETCRERKTRCDGAQPVCEACEKRGVAANCSYVRQKRASTSNDVHYTPPTRNSEPQGYDGPGFAAINHRSFESPSSMNAEIYRSLPSIRQVDSTFIDRPSSVTALFRSISDEPAKTRDVSHPRHIPQWRPTNSHRHTSFVAEPERLSRSFSVAPVLPRRRDADSYVHCYWDNIHPLYPLLHKPTFMRAYDKLWTTDDEDEQSSFDQTLFMATVNMVFALGSHFSHTVDKEHKAATSNDFYQRARNSFCYDILDSASSAMVQYLLLTVIYLHSTALVNRSHNLLGLAVRAAQTIGLHEASIVETSQLTEEMRRRIWYACVALDR